MIIIKEVIHALETIAPPVYQEQYDNAGLLVGDAAAEVKGILVCLDSTEQVVEEALTKGCNLIIAHHPIIFKGLKKITGRNYVERTILKAIKNDIAIYAIHTNLDNVYQNGVNLRIAQRLGLIKTEILSPKAVFRRLTTAVPGISSEELRTALLHAGADEVVIWPLIAGETYYSGTPVLDNLNGKFVRLEARFPYSLQGAVTQAFRATHPHANAVFQITDAAETHPQIGSGLIGELPQPMEATAFLELLRRQMQTEMVKHTALLDRPVQRVALCGGSGGFLLSRAVAQGADIFITADYKYHEFFDADRKIIIADIGHYESEQFTIQLLQELLSDKFTTFAVYSTETRTNPVYYYKG